MKKLTLFLIFFSLTYTNSTICFFSFATYKKKKIAFLEFIHEFYHFVEIEKYNYDLEEIYILLPRLIFDRTKFSPSINRIKIKKNLTPSAYIEIIKHKLAGYAAQEAYTQKSILLKFFSPKEKITSYFDLWMENQKKIKPLADIQEAFLLINQIPYLNTIIQQYVIKYEKSTIANKTSLEKYKNEFSPELYNYLQALIVIYDDLVEEYKSDQHQKKMEEIIKKNKNLLEYEIFFYTDLKSLWENHTLPRKLSFNNFNQKEQKIYTTLQSKTELTKN